MNSSPSSSAVLSDAARRLNRRLEDVDSPVLDCLSPLGRAAFYPRDIPFQAAEARGAEFNGTIGQITDGAGHVLALSALRNAISLPEDAANRGLLYSPIAGHPDLRAAWNEFQTPDSARTSGSCPTGAPVVAAGLTHAISLVADLFAGPGRDVIVPEPCWGNYHQIFGLRAGARTHRAASYRDGEWSWAGLEERLGRVEAGAPAIVILNLPSNPGGYSPTSEQRDELRELLVSAAERGPLVVLCDDAYQGLVFEDVPSESMFWELLGQHRNLIPIRGAGATKEFLFFGGRVGFLTLPFAPGSPEFEVLEDKLCSLIRSGVGSPVSLSQILLLETLRADGVMAEMETVRARLGERYRVMKRCVEEMISRLDGVRLLPCNSGAFMLLELPEPTGPENEPDAIRRRLIEDFSTGVVSIKPRFLRLAFCSVSRARIPGLVERLERCLAAVL